MGGMQGMGGGVQGRPPGGPEARDPASQQKMMQALMSRQGNMAARQPPPMPTGQNAAGVPPAAPMGDPNMGAPPAGNMMQKLSTSFGNPGGGARPPGGGGMPGGKGMAGGGGPQAAYANQLKGLAPQGISPPGAGLIGV